MVTIGDFPQHFWYPWRIPYQPYQPPVDTRTFTWYTDSGLKDQVEKQAKRIEELEQQVKALTDAVEKLQPKPFKRPKPKKKD